MTIETSRGPVVHRLPVDLANWALDMAALSSASAGHLFPVDVEFSKDALGGHTAKVR